MSGSPRDLAVLDPWNESLERSRARRARSGRSRARKRRAASAKTASLAALLDVRNLASEARDLADREPWELSLGRSRARRRAAELRFVPAGSRAKRASLGALVALTVGPAAGLADGRTPARPGSPGAEPPTTSEHAIVLSAESEGRQVKLLQQALGRIKVDGVFGSETEQAVRNFQSSRGIAVDGVAGPATIAALRGAPARRELASLRSEMPGESPAESATEREVSALGTAEAGPGGAQESPTAADQVSAVRRLQAALHLPVDGEFGPETEAAVLRLQERHGLASDGVVGAQTWGVIGVHGEETLNPPASALPSPEQGEGAGGAEAEGSGAAAAAEQTGGVSPEGTPVSAVEEAPAAPAAASGESSGGSAEPTEQASPPSEASAPPSESAPPSSPPVSTTGGGEGGPGAVSRVIAAGNEIATRPYVYGGGHGSFQSTGYDCSGSVSYALHGGGLINSTEDSTELESYGASGPGKDITIYANSEHAFMVVNGKRFDTVAQAEDGSRWSSSMTSTSGFVARHPVGY